MLRTKQLTTLSQYARTFYLTGPRCGSSDGASCTCPEDETCKSRSQKGSSLHRASAKAGPAGFRNAVGSVSHQNPEKHSYTAPAPQRLSPNSPLRSGSSTSDRKSNSVNGNFTAVPEDLVHPSKMAAKQFVKSSIATVGRFSEIISDKFPSRDGHALHTQQNCKVDSAEQLPDTIPSLGKSRDRAKHAKRQPNSSFNVSGGSNSNLASHNDPSKRAGMTDQVKAKQNIAEASAVSQRSTSKTQGQRQCIPQRAKIHPDSGISDAKSGGRPSERKVTPAVAENSKSSSKMQHPTRSVRYHAGGPSTHRSINSVWAVELYYHTLQQLQWGPAAEKALDNLQFKLDVFQANQVLKLLHDHSVAFGFFKWLKRQPGFKHDDHSYTTMIGILGQARQFGAVKRLQEEMAKEGCQPTVVTFNRLIHAYGRANYIGEAIKVFQQMQEAGHEPDRVTYCTLIDIHAKAGYLGVAMNLYQRMQEVGLSPDTFTYSAMVNCLGKGGQLAAAYKLFCEMIEQGCVPNLVTYNIMIALQAKARNYPSAVKLYRDMQGAGFRPDKITYSIVMEVLGHCGHLDEVEAVFMEMSRDWVPDEPIYGLLVDLWGKAGNVDKARAWYQSMLDAGLRPNVPTCNSLLSAFLKVHRFSDAHDVLQNMLGLGLIPSLQTYTLLLSCCTETQAQMGLCSNLMAISGHPAHMFLVSLPDAEPSGQNVRIHVGSFLDLMHSEDRESKRGLVDAVIDFLHKSGLKEEAGLVWEVAAQRNVYPDSVRQKKSSYWLINLHVMSEGTAVTALSRTLAWFQREMLMSGVGPRRIDIITGWGRRSRITGASLVRQSVHELLHFFQFPFFTENGNSGCFVGCGEPLHQWLLNSYVERMHLL